MKSPKRSALEARLDDVEKLLSNLDQSLLVDSAELADEITNAAVATQPQTFKRDGRFHIRVSEDNLHVYLSVYPAVGDGVRVSRTLVMEELRRQKIEATLVNQGLLGMTLLEAQTEEQPREDLEIATGIAPINGTDETIEFFVETPSKEVAFREDGSVDWHGGGHIKTVNAGEIIARVTPATNGVAGKDVFGKPIKAENGKHAVWQAGSNVEYDRQTNEIKAKLKGILQITKGFISVETALVVRGNVDITQGNVDFEGEVIVYGSVCNGFKVQAKGNITVTGNIEAAEVISREGSVYASTGIAGQGRAYVSAKIGVYAKYIENATVYANERIETTSIINSNVTAGKEIILQRGAGSIIGGTTRAGERVAVRKLGSPSETPTQVSVGIDLATYEYLQNADLKITELKMIAAQIEEVLNAAQKRGMENIAPEQQFKFAKLAEKLAALNKQIAASRQQRDQKLEAALQHANGTVTVDREVFGRVTVNLGRYTRTEKSPLSRVKYFIKDYEICIAKW